MPAKSKEQYRLMAAAANNKDFAKKVGISQSEAREFISENKGKKRYEKLKKTVKKK